MRVKLFLLAWIHAMFLMAAHYEYVNPGPWPPAPCPAALAVAQPHRSHCQILVQHKLTPPKKQTLRNIAIKRGIAGELFIYTE